MSGLVEFQVDRVPFWLDPVTQKVFSQDDLDRLEKERVIKDRKAGYRDRMAGYYDKWYRYNRRDEGYAYEEGQQKAVQNPKCSGEMSIIECRQV